MQKKNEEHREIREIRGHYLECRVLSKSLRVNCTNIDRLNDTILNALTENTIVM